MGRARRFVRDVLDDWGAEEFEELATLLTSELVTNAILHARSAPEVIVRLLDGQLWIGVADTSPGAPVAKHYGPTAGTGRGMLLVESMAASWGTDDFGRGKVVWFELDGHDPSEEASRAGLGADADLVAGSGPAPRRRGPASPLGSVPRSQGSRPEARGTADLVGSR